MTHDVVTVSVPVATAVHLAETRTLIKDLLPRTPGPRP
jgi:hypothetical protein